MRNSGIGGQAVLEGIMMKNRDKYAVAVRKPDKDIEVCVKEYKSLASRHKIFGLPFVRGIFSFADSLILGISTLMFSASFYDDEEQDENDQKKTDKKSDNAFKEKEESAIMTLTVIVSVIISLALFIAAPSLISDLLKKQFDIKSHAINSIVESGLRLAIFLAYIIIISRMKDIQRTFMYHRVPDFTEDVEPAFYFL